MRKYSRFKIFHTIDNLAGPVITKNMEMAIKSIDIDNSPNSYPLGRTIALYTLMIINTPIISMANKMAVTLVNKQAISRTPQITSSNPVKMPLQVVSQSS